MNIIRSNEHKEIQLWRQENPSGYLCNASNPIIHKADCIHHLGSIYMEKTAEFDLGKSEKILANSYHSLAEYLDLHGFTSKRCSHCIKKNSVNLDYRTLSDKQKDLLAFILSRPSKSSTATEIAQNLGYKNPGAVNLEVWRIAETLSSILGYTPDTREDGSKRWWPALFSGASLEDGSFLWTLKPNVEELIIEHDLISNDPNVGFNNGSIDKSKIRIMPGIPPKGAEAPRSIFQSVKVYERDRAIKVYLMEAVGCICEVCGWKSDIKDDSGEFYIEMHHLKMLSEGGSDKISNAVLVCPNCHRALHYSALRNEMKQNLLASIPRLIEEE